MKTLLTGMITLLAGIGLWLGNGYFAGPEPEGTVLQGPVPASTPLKPTPRKAFTPTTRKGYYNIDIVDDFTLPASKALIFCGAGRNLHVNQDWSKLFRRGFSALDKTRMVPDEIAEEQGRRPASWRSRLKPSQRALWIGQQYFADPPFSLGWARNSEQAAETWYRRPWGDPNARQSLFNAGMELCGGCVTFNDCPSGRLVNTFGYVLLDIENEGISQALRQEQVNLYVYLVKTIKDHSLPTTLVGSIAPIPHTTFGYSRARSYRTEPEWHWAMPAKHTATSRQRGMPDDIVGKTYADVADFQMPHSYYLYPDFDPASSHTDDGDRHWLASMLADQEINGKLSPKKRIAWQWLFNTQSSAFPNSGKAEHGAPPNVAEGMAVFYWFTGAYGAVLWDDHNQLTPDQPSPADPGLRGLGNDRNYAPYEHYIHGLWRLFNHHRDLFNGREQYLNEQTECSFDGGKTWYRYNANQLKTRNLPFVRAIVNGDQILLAATKPYARQNELTRVKVRYVQNGYQFYTDLALKGTEIYLGRATLPKARP